MQIQITDKQIQLAQKIDSAYENWKELFELYKESKFDKQIGEQVDKAHSDLEFFRMELCNYVLGCIHAHLEYSKECQ